jgi:type I restriction enzyme M protein
MPSKREVLEQLKRDELLAAVDRFGLGVDDRRVRGKLVDALAGSRKAGLADTLGELPRTRLKEICRALDLDDSGREKAILVSRLTGAAAPAKPVAPVAAPPLKRPEPKPKRQSQSTDSTARLGFEARLWQTADALRNNMDAAEYKHVVLGLIFLRGCLKSRLAAC